MDDIESIKAYHERVLRENQRKIDELSARLSARGTKGRSRKERAKDRPKWEKRHARMERLFRNAERLGKKWRDEDRKKGCADTAD